MEYTKLQLEEIRTKVEQVENFMSKGIKWVAATSNVIDKDPLTKKIKAQRRNIRTLIPRITEKPAVAFFGASQCGKSHLVKNLLKNDKGELNIWDHVENKEVNFLKYINPDGNKNEATALVTRFQYLNDDFHSNFPLKIELLSVKDIILILIDGFATIGPLGLVSNPTEMNIRDLIYEYESLNLNLNKNILSDDDVYEIKEYIEKYKNGELRSLMEVLDKVSYWQHLSIFGPKLSVNNITKFISPLWFNNTSISNLFLSLIESLESCGFSKRCYGNFDLITKQKVPVYESKFEKIVNILDVRVLNGFAETNNDKFNIYLASGNSIPLEPHILCTLSKEVSLCIPKSNNVSDNKHQGESLLDYIDILDFPGCRPGTKITSINEIPQEQQIEIIKRGKINYLFNVYSDSFQINNLAIVSNMAGQLDGANLIPHILYPWINNYIGKSPAERHQNMNLVNSKIPPLFIVLTYFNEILVYNQEKDTSDPTEKLNTALQTRLKEDIHADYSWIREWVNSESSVFRNFYLLRDFTYCRLYNKEDKTETTLNDEFKTYFDDVKTSFIKHAGSRMLFNNPEFYFDEASSPNKDGSQLIIQNLQHVRSNKFKTESILNKTNQALQIVLQDLTSYKKSDNVQERITEIKKQTRDVTNRVIALLNDNINIGYITDQLYVSELDIYQQVYSVVKNRTYGDVATLKKHYTFYLQYPRLKTLRSKEERLVYLANNFNQSINETEEYLTELGYDVQSLLGGNVEQMENKALYIANSVKTFWLDKHLDISMFKNDKKALSTGFVQLVMHTLKNNYEKLDLSKKIADYIQPYVDTPGGHLDDAIPMISSIIAGIINRHVSSFGWDYVSESEKKRLIKLCKENGIDIDDYCIDNKVENNIDTIPIIYSYLENYSDIVNGLGNEDTEKIASNPYISGYKKWMSLCNLSLVANIENTDYDIESNSELIKLLNSVENSVK